MADNAYLHEHYCKHVCTLDIELYDDGVDFMSAIVFFISFSKNKSTCSFIIFHLFSSLKASSHTNSPTLLQNPLLNSSSSIGFS